MAAASSVLARRWRIAGWVLLALGWIVAAGVYAGAADRPAGSASYSMVGGQAFAEPGGATGWQAQQIERVGGQGTLLIARLDDWLGSLRQGRRLAATLALGAVLAALACRFVAGVVDDGHIT